MKTGKMMEGLGDTLLSSRNNRRVWKGLLWLIAILLLLDFALGWYWSREPDLFPVTASAQTVPGEATTQTLIRVASTLLDKPGGYLSNDIMPHRLWLDDMPNWEFGVLIQVRDMARVLRRDMSRSQSQSLADPDLVVAEPQFNFDSKSWAIPSTEGEYQRGIKALKHYEARLLLPNGNPDQAHFYPRADNLDIWLGDVQSRLGAMSQQLSDSVGREQLDMDAPGDTPADAAASQHLKTPWLKIDDVFYQARGACWALVELMRAVEVDYAGVLKNKNATVSYRQVLRELEGTQATLWSPMVLNGSGFGLLANHSLVMANYISRANAAMIELRQLLRQG